MQLSTVSEWLNWIGTVHKKQIELGLDRVKVVAERLNVLSPQCPVIIVGGTNGKGSTVAGLEAIYSQAGFKVGTFTSPFLFSFNEQIRINQQPVNDGTLCAAFEKIETVRGDIKLTPFEFHTLAALIILQQSKLDVWILEVGLGGRLDAVNIIDVDVAVTTSISIDHTEWLGETREQIGMEKAGIYRANKPVVCGDIHPPAILEEQANKMGAAFYCQGRDFGFENQKTNWKWWSREPKLELFNLPLNALALSNMSTVLMVIQLLQQCLPVSREAIDKGLMAVHLPGRVQIVPGDITKIFDVAHNPAGVEYLASRLRELKCDGKTYAVFSMLADKDIEQSIAAIRDQIDFWYVAPLETPRAATREQLQNIFSKLKINNVNFSSSIEDAFQLANQNAKTGDRVVAFGSFHVVGSLVHHQCE